jgi:hypothetical protein
VLQGQQSPGVTVASSGWPDRVFGSIPYASVHWVQRRRVRTGDEVRVKVVEAESVDKPKVRYRRDPAADARLYHYGFALAMPATLLLLVAFTSWGTAVLRCSRCWKVELCARSASLSPVS